MPPELPIVDAPAPPPVAAARARRLGYATAFRAALGLGGILGVAAIVRSVGADAILAALRPALAWLPLLCAFELARMAAETLASWVAFGSLARSIPLATLFRAHVIGLSLSSLAPAPRVVNETIKIGLLAPYTGGPAATSVGFINQAATLISVGLFSPMGAAAVYLLDGGTTWIVALLIHSVVLVGSGVVLQALTRADATGRWLARRSPKLAARAAAFRAHGSQTGLFASGPTAAMMLGRVAQAIQLGVAARAVGIDMGVLRTVAVEGVSLVASAVGVVVPAGLGTTDGTFSLAAGVLGTTVARATSLALLMRCVQILWLPIGSVVAMVGPRAVPARGPEGAP